MVYVRFSETEEKVEVEANGNFHGYIDLDIVGNTLKIGLTGLRNVRGKETLNVYITTKQITDIVASGNSIFFIEDPVETATLKIDFSGNVNLSGDLAVGQLHLALSGNSNVDLAGNANSLNSDLSGNSVLSDYGLVVENLNIALTGNSNAFLTVNDTINVEASGNSTLSYKGNAVILQQNLTSGAKIIKK